MKNQPLPSNVIPLPKRQREERASEKTDRGERDGPDEPRLATVIPFPMTRGQRLWLKHFGPYSPEPFDRRRR